MRTRIKKKKLKIIAKIWAGSMLAHLDGGFSSEVLDDEDLDYVIEEAKKIGMRVLGKLPVCQEFDVIAEIVISYPE